MGLDMWRYAIGFWIVSGLFLLVWGIFRVLRKLLPNSDFFRGMALIVAVVYWVIGLLLSLMCLIWIGIG